MSITKNSGGDATNETSVDAVNLESTETTNASDPAADSDTGEWLNTGTEEAVEEVKPGTPNKWGEVIKPYK